MGLIARCIDCDKPLPACSDRLRCSCGIPDEVCVCSGNVTPEAHQLAGAVDLDAAAERVMVLLVRSYGARDSAETRQQARHLARVALGCGPR